MIHFDFHTLLLLVIIGLQLFKGNKTMTLSGLKAKSDNSATLSTAAKIFVLDELAAANDPATIDAISANLDIIDANNAVLNPPATAVPAGE